jgi:hypothetical protein
MFFPVCRGGIKEVGGAHPAHFTRTYDALQTGFEPQSVRDPIRFITMSGSLHCSRFVAKNVSRTLRWARSLI